MKNIDMKEEKWKKWNERNEELDSKEDQAITSHFSKMTVLHAACAVPGRHEFQEGGFLHPPKWNSQNRRLKMETAVVPRFSLKIYAVLISQSVFTVLILLGEIKVKNFQNIFFFWTQNETEAGDV